MLIDVSAMTLPNRFDVVTVGHFAIDTISSPKITPARTTLGGSPTYVSVAAAKLGADVSAVSKVGRDFPNRYLEWLQNNHVDLSGLKRCTKGATTEFVLQYQHDWKRKLQLKTLAPPIRVSDIPHSLQAHALHVAPIANELSTDAVQKLRKVTQILSLDPQGFTRDFNGRGNMRLKHWEARTVLELIDVYKSSQDEIRMVTGITDIKRAARRIQNYGAKIVIVTRGLHGASLLSENVFCNLPACKPRVLIDPTGAGDAYIGAFLAEHVDGKDSRWCACVGAAAASFVVEGVGPERFGNKEETYARAMEIYQKHE